METAADVVGVGRETAGALWSQGDLAVQVRESPAGGVPRCRKGHPLTSANRWKSKSGYDRCRECRRAHKPLKTRECKRCRQAFSGSRGKYCTLCVSLRHMDDLELMQGRPIRTRTCTDCEETKPLYEFERDPENIGREGARQYADRCADCRSDRPDDEDDGLVAMPDSPYERAKRQVERIFGVPAREWINVRHHVLADLHHLRMLAIQHAEARRTGGTLTRPDIDTRSRNLWPRLLAARLTLRTRRLPYRTPVRAYA